MAIRKNSLRYFFLVLALSAQPYLCFAAKPHQPITVKTQVDKKTVSIGDKVRYTITIYADKGLEVELPLFEENLGDFAVKDFGKSTRTFFNRKTLTQWYLLDTYVTAKFTLPKPVVKYKNSKDKEWSQIEGNQQEIEVKSLLDKSDAHLAIRDIKAPVNLPVKWLKIIFFALAALLALGGVLVYRHWRKKRIAEAAAFKRPAHEIALEQLQALAGKDYISKGMTKEYFFEISMIVRYYLENRFSLHAPEMTTEEFLAHVRDYSSLAEGHKSLLREFLSSCDMVKFAKYAPSQEEIKAVFDSAKNFIETTKDDLS